MQISIILRLIRDDKLFISKKSKNIFNNKKKMQKQNIQEQFKRTINYS